MFFLACTRRCVVLWAIAQETGGKIGFVSVRALLETIPEGQAVLEIRRAAARNFNPVKLNLRRITNRLRQEC